MRRVRRTPSVHRYLKPFAAASLTLYLFLNAFFILCLIHPHNEHLQDQANGHLASVCVWVNKTVSPHTPSPTVLLPLLEAMLFVALLLPSLIRQARAVQLATRSPPTSLSFA